MARYMPYPSQGAGPIRAMGPIQWSSKSPGKARTSENLDFLSEFPENEPLIYDVSGNSQYMGCGYFGIPAGQEARGLFLPSVQLSDGPFPLVFRLRYALRVHFRAPGIQSDT